MCIRDRAKVSDKILILENLLEKATDIIIGGGMAYTFLKAMGGKIGNSLCEEDRIGTADEIMKKATEKGVCIHLPPDSIIADKFEATADTSDAPSLSLIHISEPTRQAEISYAVF